MIGVDHFCEFAAVHRLLEHPHVHRGVELVVLGRVGAHDLGNGRAPVDAETREDHAGSETAAGWTYCNPAKGQMATVFSGNLIKDFN